MYLVSLRPLFSLIDNFSRLGTQNCQLHQFFPFLFHEKNLLYHLYRRNLFSLLNVLYFFTSLLVSFYDLIPLFV